MANLCEIVTCNDTLDVDDPKNNRGPWSKACAHVAKRPIQTCGCFTATLAVCIPLLVIACSGKIYLARDQQAVLTERHQPKRVVNGPGYVTFDPFRVKAEVKPALLLSELSYVHVRDSVLGVKKAVAGPGLFFPGMRHALPSAHACHHL